MNGIAKCCSFLKKIFAYVWTEIDLVTANKKQIDSSLYTLLKGGLWTEQMFVPL